MAQKKTKSSGKTKKTVSEAPAPEVKKVEEVRAEEPQAPVKAKKPAAQPVAKKQPVKLRNRVIEIPIFNTKVRAVFIMDRGNVSLFRGVDQPFTLQVPKDIVPDQI